MVPRSRPRGGQRLKALPRKLSLLIFVVAYCSIDPSWWWWWWWWGRCLSGLYCTARNALCCSMWWWAWPRGCRSACMQLLNCFGVCRGTGQWHTLALHAHTYVRGSSKSDSGKNSGHGPHVVNRSIVRSVAERVRARDCNYDVRTRTCSSELWTVRYIRTLQSGRSAADLSFEDVRPIYLNPDACANAWGLQCLGAC